MMNETLAYATTQSDGGLHRAARPTLPAVIRPMLPLVAAAPFDSEDHLFELKWDGVRALAFIEGGSVRLQTRSFRNVVDAFPELRRIPAGVAGDEVVLDGVVVAMDAEGRPAFDLVNRRLNLTPAAARLASVREPVCYKVFDVLHYAGLPLYDQPLWRRRGFLEGIVSADSVVELSDYVEGNGRALFDMAKRLGMDGVVAKAKDSLYQPASRTAAWLKIKTSRQGNFVIGGFALGDAKSPPRRALLLGLYDNGQLRYVGSVSAGFDPAAGGDVFRQAEGIQIRDCPFAEPPQLPQLVGWCLPALVCSIRYGEFDAQGRLRFPVFVALRRDVRPEEATVEALGYTTMQQEVQQ